MNALFVMALVSSAVDAPVDFDTQVMPILTKAGCNAGACHGAAAGRGGFHLSLYGSRPFDDFEEITRALEGRRINHRDPLQSLLLMKPMEQVNHEGGTRLDSDGDDVELIKRWIAEGAKHQSLRTLNEFRLDAAHSDLVVGQTVTVTAVAEFSDGTSEDVLPWTVLTPDDPTAVAVTGVGKLKIQRAGRHVVVARYLDRVAPLEFLVPQQKVIAPRLQLPAQESVDEFVDARIVQLGLRRGGTASDSGFVRRVSLDLTGRLPKPEDVTKYLQDDAQGKRQRLVETLLSSDAFNDCWTHHLAEMLRVSRERGVNHSAELYYRWIHDCVEGDVPFDNMARQLILSEGAVSENAPANFYAVVGDARTQAEFFSSAFLGCLLYTSPSPRD